MNVGRISELWRYPVKSMGGETIPRARFDDFGMIADRAWAAINDETGDIGWGKSFPKLMNLQARYLQDPPASRVYCHEVPPVSIHFPDGSEVSSHGNIDDALTQFVGAPLRLHALEPPANKAHYRWQTPVDYEAILKILGIGADEPPPDLSAYDTNIIELLAECFAPPGTYNDMFPVHAVTTSSLQHMEQQSGERFPVERFRPNFLIETKAESGGLIEFDWIGKQLQIGETVFAVEAKTIRCSMPARAQAPYELPQNPAIARSLFTETGRFLGCYLSIVKPGEVRAGDSVELIG